MQSIAIALLILQLIAIAKWEVQLQLIACWSSVIAINWKPRDAITINSETTAINCNDIASITDGACQGTSTPACPSARDTQIAQRGTILRVLFWLGGAIVACERRGWKYQYIISSMETLLMLNSLFRGVTFMSWRRVLRSVFLIIQKRRLLKGISRNRFMAWRQITKLTGATKKVTCLLCHQGFF